MAVRPDVRARAVGLIPHHQGVPARIRFDQRRRARGIGRATAAVAFGTGGRVRLTNTSRISWMQRTRYRDIMFSLHHHE